MVFPLWRQLSTVQVVFAKMRQLAVGRFDHRFHIGLVLVVVFLFYSILFCSDKASLVVVFLCLDL